MSNERQPGHYRVRLADVWMILFWFVQKERMFWLAPNGQLFDDGDFDEIINTPISPSPPTDEEINEMATNTPSAVFDLPNGGVYSITAIRIIEKTAWVDGYKKALQILTTPTGEKGETK